METNINIIFICVTCILVAIGLVQAYVISSLRFRMETLKSLLESNDRLVKSYEKVRTASNDYIHGLEKVRTASNDYIHNLELAVSSYKKYCVTLSDMLEDYMQYENDDEVSLKVIDK